MHILLKTPSFLGMFPAPHNTHVYLTLDRPRLVVFQSWTAGIVVKPQDFVTPVECGGVSYHSHYDIAFRMRKCHIAFFSTLTVNRFM